MKTILFAALLLLVACSPIVRDTRDPATAQATQTAIAAQPASAQGGRITIRLLTPPPVPTIKPQVALPTVTPAPECVNAKANISATGERIYHLPSDANYNTVKIDKEGEAVYCTEQEAIDAGFRRAQR